MNTIIYRMCNCYLCVNKLETQIYDECHCDSCVLTQFNVEVDRCYYCRNYYCLICKIRFIDDYDTQEEYIDYIENVKNHKCTPANNDYNCCNDKKCVTKSKKPLPMIHR
jgi:hypothetical protein